MKHILDEEQYPKKLFWACAQIHYWLE